MQAPTPAQRTHAFLPPVAVLDGGLATALPAHHLHPTLWSGGALLTEEGQAAVAAAHADFVAAGADVITTSTYQVTPQGVAGVDGGEDALAVSVALAVGAATPSSLVAVSIGPYGAYLADNSEATGSYASTATVEGLMAFHRPRMVALNAAMSGSGHPQDGFVFAFETVPCIVEVVALCRLLAEDFPERAAWLSMTVRDGPADGGDRLRSGERVADAVVAAEAVAATQLAAVGCNCVSPGVVAGALLAVASAPLVVGGRYTRRGVAYPNSGSVYDGATKAWVPRATPYSIPRLLPAWIAAHPGFLAFVGGCCNVGSDVVAACAAAVRAAPRPPPATTVLLPALTVTGDAVELPTPTPHLPQTLTCWVLVDALKHSTASLLSTPGGWRVSAVGHPWTSTLTVRLEDAVCPTRVVPGEWTRVAVVVTAAGVEVTVGRTSCRLDAPQSSLAGIALGSGWRGALHALSWSAGAVDPDPASPPPLSPPPYLTPPVLRRAPLTSVDDVLRWDAATAEDWLNVSTVPIRARFPRSPHPATASRCHAGTLTDASRPLALVCHDCGPAVYHQDGASQGTWGVAGCNNWYRGLPWDALDVFVAFSHERVSLPPVAWVNAAHAAGVRVLGTVITEWEAGSKENAALLAAAPAASAALAAMAAHYGFDGWLLNVEAPVAGADAAAAMLDFVGRLTADTHAAVPGSMVLWYDALTVTGDVQWQSCLNHANKPFFDACDGIFLDYHWSVGSPAASAEAAGDRHFDVFLGCDVWGRGTPGGGQWNSAAAVEAAAVCGLSSAVFAPAWAYEAQGGKTSAACFAEQEARWVGGRAEVPLSFTRCARRLWWGNPSTSYDLLNNCGQVGDTAHWEDVVHGGQGWGVEKDGTAPGPGTVFVTSHQGCSKTQAVDLATVGLCAADIDGGGASSVTVKEWVKGTPPNTADGYTLSVSVLDGGGAVLATHTADVARTCGEWERAAVAVGRVPPGARLLSVTHGGHDAEGWAGHFGSRMCGTCVTVEASAVGGIGGALGVRPAAAVWPFCTWFGDGAGARLWRQGVVVYDAPWHRLDLASPQVSPLPPGAFVTQDVAWCGGSAVRVASRTGASLRLFSVDVPVVKPLSVVLAVQGGGVRPVLWVCHPGGAVGAVEVEEAGAVVAEEGAWRQVEWLVDVGTGATVVGLGVKSPTPFVIGEYRVFEDAVTAPTATRVRLAATGPAGTQQGAVLEWEAAAPAARWDVAVDGRHALTTTRCKAFVEGVRFPGAVVSVVATSLTGHVGDAVCVTVPPVWGGGVGLG